MLHNFQCLFAFDNFLYSFSLDRFVVLIVAIFCGRFLVVANLTIVVVKQTLLRILCFAGLCYKILPVHAILPIQLFQKTFRNSREYTGFECK